MKKLNKVFVVLLFAVALMLLLTVNSSATVDKAMVTNEVKTITFDADYYLNTYPDLKAAFGNDSNAAYEHFLDHGISEGRCAKLTFDVAYYLNSYKDLQDAFGNDYEAAYRHFITNGAAEGRSGCLIYDSAYYAENNKDVKDAFGDNNLKIYEHYVTYGIAEGRQASEEFNVKCYLKKYKDLKDAYTETGYTNGFMHYLTYGIDEGRIGTHEYKETTVPATCEEDGYTEKVCACGDVQKVVIPSPGHKYSEAQEVTAEDTEAAGKVHKHVCETCGKVEYFDDAHNYGEEPTSTTATCTEAGEETYTCSVCGKVDVREVEAYGHNFKLNEGERLSTTTPATCGKAGFDEYVCETCGTLRLVAVQATGKHTLTKVEAKEPTCEETGNNEYYTCSVCNGVFKDAEGKQATTVEDETLAIVPHTLETVESKAATCEEAGNNEYKVCSVCGKIFKADGSTPTTVEAETIAALDHTWVAGNPEDYGFKAPTCEEDGYEVKVCETCGNVDITAVKASHTLTKVEAKAATPTEAGNNEYYTCSVCGKVFKDAEGTIETTVEAEKILTVTVDNLADLKAAVSTTSPITTVVLGADITGISERIDVYKTMTIDGKNHKLQFNALTRDELGVASAFVVGADNTVVNDLSVEMTASAGWQGNYAIQVYNAEGVKLNNVTASNGDAGIIVNASKVELTGTTTLNNNEFGGIEVSKGTAEGLENAELTVTGTIVMDNEARTVPVIWIEPEQGTVTGAGVESYYSTTETNDKDQTYYYTSETVAQTMVVNNLDELKAAISNPTVKTVELNADILGISEKISIPQTITLNGNNHRLQFNTISKDESGVASALIILADNTVVNDLSVEMTAVAEWQGNYTIQVYNAEGVTLNNITASNGDAGILVNASNVKLTGTITLVNNEFGGIEVSKGTAEGLNPSTLDISEASIVNDDEQFRVPTIWIDGENDGNVVNGADNMFDTTELKEDQIQYYLNEKYSHFPTEDTGDDDEEEQLTPGTDNEGSDYSEPVS